MKIRIVHDTERVYKENEEMEAKRLINDFIEGLNESDKNDKETIDWLNNVSEESAVKLIEALWDLSIKILE